MFAFRFSIYENFNLGVVRVLSRVGVVAKQPNRPQIGFDDLHLFVVSTLKNTL